MPRSERHDPRGRPERLASRSLSLWNIATGIVAIVALLLFSAIDTPMRPYLIATVLVMAAIVMTRSIRASRADERLLLQRRRGEKNEDHLPGNKEDRR